jgi:hypothetical protein
MVFILYYSVSCCFALFFACFDLFFTYSFTDNIQSINTKKSDLKNPTKHAPHIHGINQLSLHQMS